MYIFNCVIWLTNTNIYYPEVRVSKATLSSKSQLNFQLLPLNYRHWARLVGFDLIIALIIKTLVHNIIPITLYEDY
jgi:hypothetical protein